MPYKVHLLDALTPVEWSQATWRVEGVGVPIEDCPFERVHALMLAHLPRGGLVLDAGCGSAKWPIYLRSLGYRVVGVDVSRDACALARSADPDLGVAVADVRRLPVKRHSVDAVLSLGVVEHDERGPDHALAEVRRVLRPGGLLVLSVPYDNPLRRSVVNPLLSFVTWRRRRAGMRLGFVEYRFTAREVCRFLTDAGFAVVSVSPNDYAPPRTVGLWVDWQNLTFNPVARLAREDLFLLPRPWRRLALALMRLSPWTAAGEVAVVARAS